MLETYAHDFDAVEINFTYYRDPTPKIFEQMLRKVPAGFEFVVKAPKGLTHERERAGPTGQAFLASLEPLQSSGQLGGVIAQFPQSFHCESSSLEHLAILAEVLGSEGIDTFVEFRHRSWNDQAVYDRLRELGLGFVNVDLPRLSALPRPTNVVTSDAAYYRLHGRNADAWYAPEAGGLRYDYVYSDDELDEWAGRIDAILGSVRKVYVFNNNCHKGSSFVDAMRLKQRFDLSVQSEADVEPSLFASTNPDARIAALAERVARARADS
jgi:uncharacterized protein YecE (DUF72 family)